MARPPARLLACWGNGDFGRILHRLGHGVKCLSVDIPQLVASLKDRSMIALSCGDAHTAAIDEDGSAYTMGLNDSGQLGHSSDSGYVAEPQEMLLPEAVTAVAAGSRHTLFLAESGDVWSVGSNSHGQLGLGNHLSHSPAPRRIPALAGAKVTGIAAGEKHSLAVTAAGELLSWGCGSRGQLGHGATAVPANRDESQPRLISSLKATDVKTAAAGGARSGCIDENGQTWTWGDNANYELGHRKLPQLQDPKQVELKAISQLAFGGSNTMALFGLGAICRWGSDERGFSDKKGALEYRNIEIPGCIEKVACGWKHSAAITSMGNLYCWGWGGSQGSALTSKTSGGGQLGLGDDNDYWKPTRVKHLANGPETCSNETAETVSWRAVDISCGLNHTAALIEIV